MRHLSLARIDFDWCSLGVNEIEVQLLLKIPNTNKGNVSLVISVRRNISDINLLKVITRY